MTLLAEPFAERHAAALRVVRTSGADVLLASDAGTVRWLTGRSSDIEYGRGNWTVGTHVLVAPGGIGILCPAEEQDLVPASDDSTIYPYEAFTLGAELAPERRAATALQKALCDAGIGAAARLAIESAALPAALLQALEGRATVPVDTAIRQLRASKDASEIALIRRAAELTDAGQRAFREHLRPGISEIELWSLLHGEMERVAGCRVPVLPDLMFGDRCAKIGLPPTERRLEAGDLAMCDLVARRDGYWSDSCVTIACGTPDARAREIHDAAIAALDLGIRRARPGITAGALDAVVRDYMGDRGFRYPLHTGHGLGASGHEEPRIVPGATLMLAAGMVIALEPGAYVDPHGVRVEHVLVVTDDGGEPLTRHGLDLT